MVMERKYSAGNSRTDSFIMGQFRPHIKVRATRPISCWRLMTLVPPVTPLPAP